MTIIITGAAGFIGFHVAQALLAKHYPVIGVDNLTPYYNPSLKQARLEELKKHKGFIFIKADISSAEELKKLDAYKADIQFVLHFAAQPGVRYSLINPYSYVTANVMGQVAILEWARHLPALRRLLYASSSSVYGLSPEIPYSEADAADQPASLYAATKRSAELIAFSYRHVYGLPLTGLRFFTVYGPWGRPDMAYFKFADHIMQEKPITLYKGHNLSRDFTYVEDVVRGILAILKKSEESPSASAFVNPVLNIGNSKQEPVIDMVRFLEQNLGKKAVIRYEERPVADMESTLADTNLMFKIYGWRAETCLCDGLRSFCRWYLLFF